MNERVKPHMASAEVKKRAIASKAGMVIRLWELDGTHADSLTLLNLFTSFPDHDYNSEIATIMIDGTRYAVTSVDEESMKVAVLVNMSDADVAEEPVEPAANYQKKTLDEYKAWWLEGLKRDGIELVVPDKYIKTIDSDAALKGDVAPPPTVDK